MQSEPNLSYILLEVDKTMHLHSAFLNKQKNQRWPTSVSYYLRYKAIKIEEGDLNKNR